MRSRPAFAVLLASAVLAGCVTPTPYARPDMPAPGAWSAPPAQPADLAAGDGWTAFDEPPLDALTAQVLARNNTLAAAVLRVRRAGLQAGLAADARRPQITAGGSASASRSFETGPTTRGFGLNGSVAYEVDLFDRLGRLQDAADWEAEATAEDRDAARLSLVGATANLYFQRLHLRERLALADAGLAHARRTQALVETQYAAGEVSALERAEAGRTVEAQQAQRAQIVQQAAEAENALVALLDGAPPVAAAAGRGLADIPVPGVDAGVPADLLARRPDLRAAEARLRAGLANVDATTASFYPGFSLTGGAGGSSAALRDLLANPTGTLAASLTLPFLNLERARLTRAVSRAQFDESVAAFRQSYRQALAEVENALSARVQLAIQEEHLARSLAEARDIERLYEVRYRAGAVALRDWLAAQETRRQAEAALLDNRRDRLSSHVQLILVLGGDIGPTAPAPST